MMGGKRLVRRIVQGFVDEAPPRTEAELDHLENPRWDETEELLAVKEALPLLPLSQGLVEDILPAVELMLEEKALDCEQAGDPGDEARAEVREFLDALRGALA